MRTTYMAGATLGESVGMWRRGRGWTTRELAEKAEVSQAAVIRLERGLIISPSLATLVGLADAFGLTLDQMVGRREIRLGQREQRDGIDEAAEAELRRDRDRTHGQG